MNGDQTSDLDRDGTGGRSAPSHDEWLASFRAAASAIVERELVELEMRERAGRIRPHQRHGANGSSSVFSLRLDHDERAALEARAGALKVKPTVLARNLIRAGLTRSESRADEILDDIDAQVLELRALLGR